MAYKRILVPVDGSRVGAQGLKAAIKLAKQGRGRLLLLHVVEGYAAIATPDAGASIGSVLKALRAGGQRMLARASRSAARGGVKPKSILVESFGRRVADTIVEQSARVRADLIVMGTHGRRGLQRALLGSDAETVVRYSRVPVLLVPERGRRKR
jgi:nucleotide-binding universal stress UspA family protein